ncbi:MAG: FAD:protein FMN transferase [Bacteroidia bacterium]|nr:FAD:protein FMN transferase [Bacteroidia bacterium]
MRIHLPFYVFLTFIFVSCGTDKPAHYRKIAGFTQGTTFHITYEDNADKDLSGQVDSIFKVFDLTFSEYIPNSIVSGINQNDSTVLLDDMFIEVINKSIEINRETHGALDLTVGPLVDAWGFGPEKKAKIDSSKIDSLLQYVGMEKIRLEGRKLIKNQPGIKIDVNSIAQGYCVDVVYRYFEKLGIENFMVEIGGEVRTKGKNPKNDTWRIGVDKPGDGKSEAGENLQTIILLDNKAVTTSGNYRKFFEENGRKYSHIIDPHTGYPYKNSLLSVTVIAKDGLTADGYDTPLMVLGLEGARALLKQHPELDAYMIYSDENGRFQVEYTKGIQFDKD